jgi:RNA polymerase sigma-70 factor (ECF subfamily)
MSSSHEAFATTRWTLLWQAAKEDSATGRPALEEVISRYWMPLYSFARRRGLGREDAEDATQEFLQNLVSGRLIETADPAKGKFRGFLLTALKRFLVDQYRHQNAQKRGGEARVFSLDFESGEQAWLQLESKSTDPDQIFHLAWAESLLDEVRGRLRGEYSGDERNKVFNALMPVLSRQLSSQDYASLSQQTGLTSGALRVALHRLRQRFAQTLRSVVAETIDDPDEIDAEIGLLVDIMANRSNGSR